MFRVNSAATVSAVAGAAGALTPASSPANDAQLARKIIAPLCLNGRCFQRMATHNGDVLAHYLTAHYPSHAQAVRTRRGTPHTPVHAPSAGSGAPGVNAMLPLMFEQFFVSRDFIEGALGSSVRAGSPPPCVLPLPEVCISPTPGGLMAREMFHISCASGFEHYDWSDLGATAASDVINAIASATAAAPATAKKKTAAANKKSASAAPAQTATERRTLQRPEDYSTPDYKVQRPRDALSGNFLQREELVDNLMLAARHFGWQNPFWIRADHPQLHKYLRLAAPPGFAGHPSSSMVAAPGILQSTDALASSSQDKDRDYAELVAAVPNITVGLSSVVYFLEQLESRFPVQFLHRLLRPDPNSPHVAGNNLSACYDLKTNAAAIHRGMNAATGFVSKSPYFSTPEAQKLSPSGLWLSLEQVLRYRLRLKDGSLPTYVPRAPAWAASSPAAATNTTEKKKTSKKSSKANTDIAPATLADATSSPSSHSIPTTLVEYSGGGRLIEIDEWSVYNAEQLAVPGRVALKQAAIDEDKPETSPLFK